MCKQFRISLFTITFPRKPFVSIKGTVYHEDILKLSSFTVGQRLGYCILSVFFYFVFLIPPMQISTIRERNLFWHFSQRIKCHSSWNYIPVPSKDKLGLSILRLNDCDSCAYAGGYSLIPINTITNKIDSKY